MRFEVWLDDRKVEAETCLTEFEFPCGCRVVVGKANLPPGVSDNLPPLWQCVVQRMQSPSTIYAAPCQRHREDFDEFASLQLIAESLFSALGKCGGEEPLKVVAEGVGKSFERR